MDSSVSIGETLRRRREERALTAEQAAFRSKVPLRLVQMLESDDYQLLPDPLYLVACCTITPAFLDLDVAALDAEFQHVMYRPARSSPPSAPPRACGIDDSLEAGVMDCRCDFGSGAAGRDRAFLGLKAVHRTGGFGPTRRVEVERPVSAAAVAPT